MFGVVGVMNLVDLSLAKQVWNQDIELGNILVSSASE